MTPRETAPHTVTGQYLLFPAPLEGKRSSSYPPLTELRRICQAGDGCDLHDYLPDRILVCCTHPGCRCLPSCSCHDVEWSEDQ